MCDLFHFVFLCGDEFLDAAGYAVITIPDDGASVTRTTTRTMGGSRTVLRWKVGISSDSWFLDVLFFNCWSVRLNFYHTKILSMRFLLRQMTCIGLGSGIDDMKIQCNYKLVPRLLSGWELLDWPLLFAGLYFFWGRKFLRGFRFQT